MSARITRTTISDLVPDAVLRELSRDTPERAMGELSDEHLAMVATNLCDLADELLMHRARARGMSPQPRPAPFAAPRNHAEEIANIRKAGL